LLLLVGRPRRIQKDYSTGAAGRETAAEFITRPLPKIDTSRLVGQESRVLEVGVGCPE
jgi:hypothetical protein